MHTDNTKHENKLCEHVENSKHKLTNMLCYVYVFYNITTKRHKWCDLAFLLGKAH